MAKVKFDVSEAEVRNFEVPKPGVYDAHIVEMSHGDSSSGNPMFTIVFEVTKGDHKGARIWHYILTDGSQDWRLREFTEAVGLGAKGTVDTDKLNGTVVQLRTAIDAARDGYDEKARVKNVMPASSKNGGAPEAEGEEDEPYNEWSLDDLKEEVAARELKVSGRVTKKKLVDALEADDEEAEGGEEEEEEEEEEEGDGEELTRADLDKMDRTELKAFIKEEELEVKVLRKHTDDDLRDKIAEALELGEDEDEEEEEGDDEEEEKDYEKWEVSELKSELKERGLRTDGRKSQLVARLKKDDASDDEPF